MFPSGEEDVRPGYAVCIEAVTPVNSTLATMPVKDRLLQFVH